MKLMKVIVVLWIVLAVPGLVLAADEAATKSAGETTLTHKETGLTTGVGIGIGGACIGAGLAAIGGGYAIAKVGSQCIESMARQPEAASQMFAPMIVTAAMIEGAMLFAIVVSLIGVLSLI